MGRNRPLNFLRYFRRGSAGWRGAAGAGAAFGASATAASAFSFFGLAGLAGFAGAPPLSLPWAGFFALSLSLSLSDAIAGLFSRIVAAGKMLAGRPERSAGARKDHEYTAGRAGLTR